MQRPLRNIPATPCPLLLCPPRVVRSAALVQDAATFSPLQVSQRRRRRRLNTHGATRPTTTFWAAPPLSPHQRFLCESVEVTFFLAAGNQRSRSRFSCQSAR